MPPSLFESLGQPHSTAHAANNTSFVFTVTPCSPVANAKPRGELETGPAACAPCARSDGDVPQAPLGAWNHAVSRFSDSQAFDTLLPAVASQAHLAQCI